MTLPILLFGMPRSGTTWLGKIFDSHPYTLYRHEPDSVHRLINMPLIISRDSVAEYEAEIRAFYDRLPLMNTARVCAKLPIFPKTYLSAFQIRLLAAGAVIAKLGQKLFSDFPVIGGAQKSKHNQVRIVWKSIESLGRFGLILRILEPAYGVHIIRHPCGYVASVLRGERLKNFSSKCSDSEDYGVFEMLLTTEQAQRRELDINFLKALDPVERLAWRWLLFNEKAMEDVADLSRCQVVRYEDICSDPYGMLRKLFQFTQLPWSTQTETFIRKSTTKENVSFYSVFKDSKKAACRWKHELHKRDADKILQVTQSSKPGMLYGNECS